MSEGLRRSARLSQQYTNNTYNTLPAFLTSPSTSSTTSQSSPVIDGTSITAQHQQDLQLHTQFLNLPSQSAAPLPSPSASDCSPFLGSSHLHSSFAMPEQGQGDNQMPTEGQNAQATTQHAQTSTAQHHNSFSSQQRVNLTHDLQNQSQGPPPGFLAEAAKRAQMACLMRDLGDVSL